MLNIANNPVKKDYNCSDSTDGVSLFKSLKYTTLSELKLAVAEDISFITEEQFNEIADSSVKAKLL